MNASRKDMAEVTQLTKRVQRRAKHLASGDPLSGIEKKPYTKAGLIDAYKRHGKIKPACEETGCPPYIAFIWLRREGLLNGEDRESYGTNGQRQGRAAELEFQRLVPDAMDCNAHISDNHPGHDFIYGGVRIDVKFSTITARGCWLFNPNRGHGEPPDFYVLFATEGKSLEDGYRCFVFPREMVLDKTVVQFRPDVPHHWWDFEVKPEALAAVLHEADA